MKLEHSILIGLGIIQLIILWNVLGIDVYSDYEFNDKELTKIGKILVIPHIVSSRLKSKCFVD